MNPTFPYYIHLQVTKSEMRLGNPYIWLYLSLGLSLLQPSFSLVIHLDRSQLLVWTPSWLSLCHQDISFYVTSHFGAYHHLEQDNILCTKWSPILCWPYHHFGAQTTIRPIKGTHKDDIYHQLAIVSCRWYRGRTFFNNDERCSTEDPTIPPLSSRCIR